ncbi:hypothetical protein ACFX14_003078 [Malus domestica]
MVALSDPLNTLRLRSSSTSAPVPTQQKNNLRILVADGGIGGLSFALAVKKKGFDVVVFEKDLSVVRGEEQYRGCGIDVAKDISKSLASSAVITKVNGELWDMARPLEYDCELKLFKFEDDEGCDTFWHSSAHILGQALEVEYGCKLCIVPCTTRGETHPLPHKLDHNSCQY